MGVQGGSITTDIIRNGLVFNMDPANRASTIPSTSTDKAFNTVDPSISGSFVNDTFYDSSTISPSFAFDGASDYINLAQGPNFTSAHSFSSWFKTTNTGTQTIWSASSDGTPRFFLRTSSTQLRLRFQYPDQSTFTLDNTQTMSNGNWHNVCFTVDGTTNANGVVVYFNGSALSTKGTLASLPLYTMNSNWIGAYPNTWWWNGNLGPIQMYNRGLSSTEVLHNYNALKGRFGL